jgi:hypothetical protein
VSVRYVELADYLAIAAEITGLDTPTLIRVTKVDLAESALHAPAAGFGETEFYPDFIDKAAVLIVRLAKNHRCPTATSEQLGWRYAYSSRSTTGHGTPRLPLMTPSEQYSPSQPAHGAKTMQALGYAVTLHQHQLAQHRSTPLTTRGARAEGMAWRKCESSLSTLIPTRSCWPAAVATASPGIPEQDWSHSTHAWSI